MKVIGRDGGKNVVQLDDGSQVMWTDEELAEKQGKSLEKIAETTAAMVEIQTEVLGSGEKAMTAPPENKAVTAPPAKKTRKK